MIDREICILQALGKDHTLLILSLKNNLLSDYQVKEHASAGSTLGGIKSSNSIAKIY